jgi:hypothetical protein
MPQQRITANNQSHTLTATIASGQSLSDALRIALEITLIGLIMPAAWDAADITFQASWDGSTYRDLFTQDGTEVTVTAAAGQTYYINNTSIRAFPYLKLRSGTTALPVNQTAARTITLITSP